MDVEENKKPDVEEDEVDRKGRPTWQHPLDALITLVGLSVGTGNVWRFPYLCYKNGGGVFFIPYFITLFAAGIPVLFLEISLGQFMSRSDFAAWDIVPAFKGIGVATTIIVWYLNLYYIIVISWAVYYFYSSLTLDDLPWSYCQGSFKGNCFSVPAFNKLVANLTDNCTVLFNDKSTTSAEFNSAGCPSADILIDRDFQDPAEMFWEQKVLGLTDGLDELGGLQWHLVLSLLVAWVAVWACIVVGIRVTGKVVYVTALFPYVMLTVLLIRGVTLDGCWEGIKFYMKPDFSKLSESGVWLDAGTQIFWSMSLGIGAMPAMGSWNKYRHNCLRDTLIYSAVNSCTSILAGFCLFAVMGYMAKQMGVSVDEVATGGPGLAFVVYPKAVSLMGGASKFYSALFFLMLIFLGMDSEFVAVEGFTAQVMDAFPKYFKFPFARPIVTTLVAITSFFIGLLMVTKGGMYIVQIMDFYSASGLVLLFIVFWEAAAIAYGYGGMRYLRDLEAMLGVAVPVYFPCCWYVVTPLICVFISAYQIQTFEPLTYGGYTYPDWSEALGWAISASTCIMVPLGAAVQLHRYKDDTRLMTTPIIDPHQVHEGTEEPYRIRGDESLNNRLTGKYVLRDVTEF